VALGKALEVNSSLQTLKYVVGELLLLSALTHPSSRMRSNPLHGRGTSAPAHGVACSRGCVTMYATVVLAGCRCGVYVVSLLTCWWCVSA